MKPPKPKAITLREFVKAINGGRELTAHEDTLVRNVEKVAADRAAKRTSTAASISRISGLGVDAVIIIDDPHEPKDESS